MSLKYYKNYLKNISITPNESWRKQQQYSINSMFDDTTIKKILEEESDKKDFNFNQIECWVGTVTDLITNSTKDSENYRSLYFKDCNHNVGRGRYFKWDNNYWLSYDSTTELEAISKCKIRRCNNWLKWVTKNGELIEYPCVMGDTLMSPSQQVSKTIITANRHVTVMIQGNKDTNKIKINDRFIINGKPYKFIAINNDKQNDYITKDVPLLYLELYLDMKQPLDNINDNIADDTRNMYSININQDNIDQIKGFSGQLTTTSKYNGYIIKPTIEWYTDNPNIVDIKNDGRYTIISDFGEAKIYAKIKNNNYAYDSITISARSNILDNKVISIEPNISELFLMQPKLIKAKVYNNGVEELESIECIDSGDKNCYTIYDNKNNTWTLENIQQTKIPLKLKFISESGIEKEIIIKLKSLF